MKRNKSLVIASCLIGLISATAYSSRIRDLRDDIARLSERIPLLTVNRNIKAGETLTAEDFQEAFFLKEQVSGRTVRPGEIELITGRQVIHPVPAGDPILWTDFPEGPRVRFPTEKVPPGYRVIALPADEIHTLVHFISPGDKVDIVSSTFDGFGDKLVSRPIAKSVTVIAVGRRLEGQSGNYATGEYPLSVSLLVEPDSALEILRASQSGEIHFLARGSHPLKGARQQVVEKTSAEKSRGEKP